GGGRGAVRAHDARLARAIDPAHGPDHRPGHALRGPVAVAVVAGPRGALRAVEAGGAVGERLAQAHGHHHAVGGARVLVVGVTLDPGGAGPALAHVGLADRHRARDVAEPALALRAVEAVARLAGPRRRLALAARAEPRGALVVAEAILAHAEQVAAGLVDRVAEAGGAVVGLAAWRALGPRELTRRRGDEVAHAVVRLRTVAVVEHVEARRARRAESTHAHVVVRIAREPLGTADALGAGDGVGRIRERARLTRQRARPTQALLVVAHQLVGT